MGLLVDGKWQDKWYDTEENGGRFEREDAGFRNWITADGSAGPTGVGGFKAEPDRYHLYVSLACPWAHRTLIYRKLKGLEQIIPISVVNPYMGENGWTFAEGEGVIPDPLIHADYAYELYIKAKPNYTGRVTVPILWDKKTNTIVSNESSEIIRMFNSAFDDVGALAGDFSPASLLPEIDDINAFVYTTINNGVYKAGFSTTQEAYEEAVIELFAALDTLEARLADKRYLTGSTITEADWRLFTTLVRFDAVYVGHFKCNLRRIIDYPNLWGYLRDLYQVPGIAETVNMEHIKQHYYTSHANINPTRIIPIGPAIDFTTAHHRDQL
ncbi:MULTISPECIES: glutathione S-transferase family protein [Psychrobacter]|jgi:putative glutathione S-transferase|uniref:Glutathione-dependent reductase n=2 Tax=Psychrobacter TaxID=497 RepID=A0A1G6VJA4_9GAMM|nr:MULTISPECIES: glutathione S-transferase family protein [Psychrobacter]MDH4905360.1 glutathione S-transferase family protein [Psychrobacter pocilloporae]BBI66971.1 glutathione-dependent reductase [Psychrobacter sp. KH172YL61]GLR28485.1 glutathione-dependent reductase [Psychrobacter pacificensis]SDD52985.1 putative glutathione S-transferase [Psychrobacter pacificensis]|tara:strand:+ start:9314 stop:10291 length:978 start_codon:yes stop_codon:yes gene_type:complete